MNELAPCPSQKDFPKYGPMSLWDMQRFHAEHIVILARNLRKLEEFIDTTPDNWNALLQHKDEGPKARTVRSFLVGLRTCCENADLQHAEMLIKECLSDIPQTSREMNLLFKAIVGEMKQRLYIRIPEDQALYWENSDLLNESTKIKFPTVVGEITASGTAYACDLHNASVFHSMRAAEVGLRVLAEDLNVEFPHGNLSLEQWHSILEQIESKIGKLKNLKKSSEKAENQRFYSQAAAQFRYFKDGYRVRVAHVHDVFSPQQSLSILNQTREFFEVLSQKISEQGQEI